MYSRYSMDPSDAKTKDSKHVSPRLESHRSESEKAFSTMSFTTFNSGPSWSSQLSVMLYKNYLFLIRSWKLTALVVFSPFVFISLLVLIDALPIASFIEGYTIYEVGKQSPIKHYPSRNSIHRCISFNGVGCKTIRYACNPRNNTSLGSISIDINEMRNDSSMLLKLVSKWNDLEDDDIEGYSSEQEMMDFIYANPNATQNAILFHEISNTGFIYTILYNVSSSFQRKIHNDQWPDGRLALQSALDRAYLTCSKYGRANESLNLDFSTQDFPRKFSEDRHQSRAFHAYATLFFYSGLMIQFVFFLFCICQEKDLLLRQGLKMIGLRDSVYWTSWTITGIIISALVSLTTIVIGYIYSIYFYTNVPFFLHLLVNIVFSTASLVMAFFISVFIQSSRASMTVGIMFYFIGIIMMATYSNEIIFNDLFLKTRSTGIRAFCYIFALLLPPHGLARVASGINVIFVWNKIFNGSDLHHDAMKIPQYTWKDFMQDKLDPGSKFYGNPEYYEPDIYSLYLTLACIVLLAVLTWYFDNVIPGINGKPHPWNFLFKKWYWTHKKHENNSDGMKLDSYPNVFDQNVKIDRFTKIYPALESDDKKLSWKTRQKQSKEMKTRRVVDGLSITLKRGEIFCLLGHNGAGKSTTIKMLTGLIEPDEGDAWIFGNSVRTSMDDIRKYLGICPQHDILWDDLTAREHIYIFSRLKNVPKNQIDTITRDVLEQLQLLQYADQRVGTFSGGMKRRLSVGLAFLGDSQVVFLDEPTTGMDPIIRRQIWQLILRQLEDRVVLMTTHTMEEADVLAKHIAVMGNGKILTEGSPISLKNKHSGYIIDIYSQDERMLKVSRKEIESMGSIKISPLGLSASNIVAEGYRICVPPEDVKILPNVIEFLERSDGISFNMMQSTLEDAFVQITRQDNKINYYFMLLDAYSYERDIPMSLDRFALIQAKLERLQFAQYEFHKQYNQLLYQNERLQHLAYAHARTFSASNDTFISTVHNNQSEDVNPGISME